MSKQPLAPIVPFVVAFSIIAVLFGPFLVDRTPPPSAHTETLKVEDGVSLDGYSRDAFGPAWADVDRNGCDTRNDILARDLSETVFKPGTRNCVVTSGVLQDPYTGKTINFKKGNKTSGAVQIDHVVALGDAWASGAKHWDDQTRLAFANDPDNLLAVDGRANAQKGASNAGEWLPENEGFRCEYARMQARVKNKYGLSVTSVEKKVLDRQLASCKEEEK